MRAFAALRASVLALFPALLAVFFCQAPALASDTVVDGVIAVVNGKIITKYEQDIRMQPVYEQLRGRTPSTQELMQVETLKKQILDQLVDDQLILQDAERYKLKITDAEVEEQIKDFLVKRNLSEAEFKRQLELQRVSREEFGRNMRRDMIKHRIIGGVVSNKVVVTDSEVEERYKERKAEFSKDSMVQLALILVPGAMSPADLKADIEAGKMTFAQAADKYSQGPGVGNGGDIGFIAWKEMAPEWRAALVGLKPGQISQPVRIQDFAGLLEVVSLKEGEELPLEAVREQIYQSLHEGKFEAVFKDYMEKLRAKAVIEYKNL